MHGRQRPPVLRATAVTAGCLVAVGLVGTLSMRHFGGVPFSVPSWPWYHSWPSYLFWQPALDPRAAVVALPVALAACAGLLALAQAERVGRGLRLAGSLVAVATLALAVAALAGGPAAWAAPLAYVGEYPGRSATSGRSPPSSASSRPGCRPCPTSPPSTRRSRPCSTPWSTGSGPGWTRPPWPPWPPAAWACWWRPAWPATSSATTASGSRCCAGPWPR